MESVFFEKIHNAASDFPYVDYNMQDINYFAHVHDEVEIVYITEGKTHITCDDSCFLAKKGDICIFMPTEIHSFFSSDKNSMYIIKLHCNNSKEKLDFSHYRLKNNPIEENEELNHILLKQIKNLVSEIKERKTGYAFMANSISQQILSTLIRCGRLVKINSEFEKKQIYYANLLRSVNEYIEVHYKEHICLNDICTHCNISTYYFAHIFKTATQSTFYNYLTAYRLNKALELLLHSDKKIIDIAQECGFSNTRSFNRSFKSFFSKTPSEYIKENSLTV